MIGTAASSVTFAVKTAEAPSDEVNVKTASALFGASGAAANCRFTVSRWPAPTVNVGDDNSEPVIFVVGVWFVPCTSNTWAPTVKLPNGPSPGLNMLIENPSVSFLDIRTSPEDGFA